MITEKTYLEAQKIVYAYNEQLRIADVIKSVCVHCNESKILHSNTLCAECWNNATDKQTVL